MALHLVTSSWKWAADLTASAATTIGQPPPELIAAAATTTGQQSLAAASPPPPPTLDPLCCAAEIHGQLESLQRACRGSAAAGGGGDHPTTLLDGLPFLVVLGRQSAGKSTVLNRLLGLPLLPSDAALTTRVPCEMRCHRGRHPQHGDERVEFGHNDSAHGGRWVVDQSVVLDAAADPVVGGHQQQQPAWVAAVHRALAQATRERAGAGHHISAHAVVVRVYSHRVPNVALIDLPGFTAVAKSSQAADLPRQLEQLALSYVRRPQALLVVVVTARVDFEAHEVLHFLRERDCDPTGERTIGLITKCDTLHDGDVGAYLRGDADPNLLLPGGGYWALCTPPPAAASAGGRSGSSSSSSSSSVDEREAAYFATHPVYGVVGGGCVARCGVTAVRAALLSLLTRRVCAELPAFRQRLLVFAEATAQRSRELGAVAPATAAEALATLVRWLHEWADQYTVALYGGGGGGAGGGGSGSHDCGGSGQLPPPPLTAGHSSTAGALLGPPTAVGNVGRHLKRLWLDYARTVGELQPFRDATVCSDEYVHELLLDCEGLHLSSRRQPPLLLIERLLTSPTQRPLEWLRAPSLQCLHAVLALLRRTVDATFRGVGGHHSTGTPLARCPLLCAQVRALLDERFAHWHRVGAALIEQLLRAQHFIFQVEPLDDQQPPHWQGVTAAAAGGATAAAADQATTAQWVRALAARYYAANPVRDFQSCLPRLLMSELVDDTQRYLRNDLLLALHEAQPGADLVHLLQPDERVAVERRELDATARVLASVQALVRTLETR